MIQDEIDEKTITLLGVSEERTICPFSEGRWKKAGDALVLVMLFGMPILYLIAFLLIR